MARSKGSGILAASLVFVVGFSTIVYAGDSKECKELAYFKGAGRKLGRGVANIVSCPFEIIRTPHLVAAKDGEVAGSTVGIVHGLGAVLKRGVVGVVEVFTFPFPYEGTFDPLLEPEFIFAHGDWNS